MYEEDEMQAIIDVLREIFPKDSKVNMRINSFDGGLEVSFSVPYFDVLKRKFGHICKVEQINIETSSIKGNYNYWILSTVGDRDEDY